MLEVDPYKRPTLSQVMAHPWLAPRLYRLTTTLGALPCSSTSRRLPSVTPLLGQSFLQSSRPPRKRSASPFSHTITNVIRGEWDENHKFCSEVRKKKNISADMEKKNYDYFSLFINPRKKWHLSALHLMSH